jgi:hypothetical protein
MATTKPQEIPYWRIGPVPRGLPFANGDRLDQPTFHQLYLTTPEWVKAELIGGTVYVASPTSPRHGRPHLRVVHWAASYIDETPGTDALDNTTTILDIDNEPQPDVCILVEPDCGGQTTLNDKGYVVGACEFVAEIASSSVNVDLHEKKRAYESSGVREYLVVLVDEERVVWFARKKKGFVEVPADEDGIYRSQVFPGLWLDPVTLFQKSPRRMNAVLQMGLATPEHAAFVAKLEAQRARKKPKTNGKKRGTK